MRVITLAPLCLFALSLAACDSISMVRGTLYSSGAAVGNRYCQTRDPILRDSVLGRINARLQGQGAIFTLLGVDCHDDAGPLIEG